MPSLLKRPVSVVLLFSAAVHCLMLLSLVFHFLDPLFDDATHRSGQGVDFYSIYQSGQNVADGVSVYSKDITTLAVPYAYVYRYLPFSAYTFGQFFRLFTPQTAYTIWVIILELLLLFNIKLTRTIFSDTSHVDVATAIWLLFSPYYLELYMGQFSFMMATLFFWMMYYWTKGNNKLGDGLWMLSLLVKTNSVLFIPVLLKMRKRKTIIAAIFVVCLFSIPYFVSIPGSFSAFAKNITEGLSVETIAGNQGFTALLAMSILRFGGQWISNVELFFQNIPVMNTLIGTPLMIWIICIFGLSIFVTIRSSHVYTKELFVVWILSYFLTYKHVWEHHYVMLLPVFVLMYQNVVKGDSVVSISKNSFWILFTMISLPTPFILIDRAQIWYDPEFVWTALESFMFHTAKPLAVLIFYVILCFKLWKYGSHNSLVSITSGTGNVITAS